MTKQLSQRVADVESGLRHFEQWSGTVKAAVDEIQDKIAELWARQEALILCAGKEKVQAALDELARQRLEQARVAASEKESRTLDTLREKVEQGLLLQVPEVGPSSVILCRSSGDVPEPMLLDCRRPEVASVFAGKTIGDVVGSYTILIIFDPTNKVTEQNA